MQFVFQLSKISIWTVTHGEQLLLFDYAQDDIMNLILK